LMAVPPSQQPSGATAGPPFLRSDATTPGCVPKEPQPQRRQNIILPRQDPQLKRCRQGTDLAIPPAGPSGVASQACVQAAKPGRQAKLGFPNLLGKPAHHRPQTCGCGPRIALDQARSPAFVDVAATGEAIQQRAPGTVQRVAAAASGLTTDLCVRTPIGNSCCHNTARSFLTVTPALLRSSGAGRAQHRPSPRQRHRSTPPPRAGGGVS